MLIWVGVGFFGWFLRGAAPTFTAGDGGELVAAAWHVGVPHPPGYAAWVLLGRTGCLLPLGSAGFRCAVISSLCAALAAVFMGCAAWRVSKAWTPGLVAAGMTALAKTLSEQAVVAEVYGMNAFLCSLLLLATLEPQRKGRWLLLSVLVGLGLGSHYTSIVLAAPLGLGAFMGMRRRDRAWTRLVLCLSLFTIGAAICMILPLRAETSPAMNWGNPRDLHGLAAHLLRSQYETHWTGPRSWQQSVYQLKAWGLHLGQQWGGGLLLFAPVGMLLAWRKLGAMALWQGVALLLSGPLLALFLNPSAGWAALKVMDVFYIPSHLVAGLWVGIGAARVALAVRVLGRKGVWLGNLLLLTLLMIPLAGRWSVLQRRSDWAAHSYGKDLLRTCGRNDLLFVSTDYQGFSVAFHQLVEERQTGVPVRHTALDPETPLWTGRWRAMRETDRLQGARRLIREWSENVGGEPVFLARWDPHMEGMRLIPYGLGYRLHPEGMPTPDSRGIWELYVGPETQGPGDFYNRRIACSYLRMKGVSCLEAGDVQEAQRLFRALLEKTGPERKEVSNNLGTILAFYGMHREAIPYYEQALDIDPRFHLARSNLGLACLEMREWEKALQHLQAALEIEPESPVALNAAGKALYLMGRRAEAVTCWRRSLEANPNQPELRALVPGGR